MKKRLSRLACVGLVITMLAGLTACGVGAGQTSGNSGGSGSNSNSADTSLAKEGVYAEQEIQLPDMGDDYGIRMLTEYEDKVYSVYEVYHWSEENYLSDIRMISMNRDGSDAQMVTLQVSSDAASMEADEGADTATEAESEKISGEVSTENEGDIALDDMMEYYEEKYEYTGVGRLIIHQGQLYGTKEHYLEDYTDPDNPLVVSENFVCCWNLDGTLVWEKQIEGLQTEEEYYYVTALLPAEEGITLLLSGDSVQTMSVSEDGTFSDRVDLPGEAEPLNYAMETFVKGDSAFAFIYWDETDGSTLWYNTFDLTTNTMGEPAKLPDSFMMSGYMSLASGGELADIVYTNSSGVYSLNVGEESPKQIMSFVNSDLDSSNMNYILMLDESAFVGYYYDSSYSQLKCSLFTKVNPEDIPDKQVLVLAGSYVDYAIRERVVAFNKSSDEYRIVIKEYSDYNTMDDYMASYTQLNNDILSGGMPDILVADYNMPIESYIAKGLVADVDSLIENDAELSKVEFLQNVFDAYRVDGKLYYVIPSFYVRTMIGKTSIVGDRSTWTMQQMQELAATLPDGTEMIGEMTRESFMYMMMQYCGSDFVDVSTGKCDFDSENFISMLEYAGTLPEEYSEDYFGDDYWMNYESQYREDRTVLMSCYIGSVRDAKYNINGYFGEDVSYIGFPTDSGDGTVLSADSMYVLSAKSQNLDGAWEFVRYYLTEDYQAKQEWSLPVTRTQFMEQVSDGMENPYYIDENGEKQEYEDTIYLNGEDIVIPNLSQEQADEFVSFVESVSKRSYYNEDVMNIIMEESDAFFQGQKSAQDVAAIIQSRVQIFVNENM